MLIYIYIIHNYIKLYYIIIILYHSLGGNFQLIELSSLVHCVTLQIYGSGDGNHVQHIISHSVALI